MGLGYQGQGHNPSSGLIHALHQGVGAPRCVCVSHARHRGGGGHGCRKLQWGGGAAVDREEVNDGEKQKDDRDWLHGLHFLKVFSRRRATMESVAPVSSTARKT